MIFLLGILIVFLGVILLYKPQNISLKDNSNKTILNRIKETKGSIILGTILLSIAMITFDIKTLRLTDDVASIFGLSKIGFFEYHFFFQILTSNLLHFDLLHISANVSAILLLIAYERRIGTLRYLIIFSISSIIASFLELFLIRQDTLSLGASAGIAGLACGFFIDYGKITLKEWIIGILLTLFIVGLLSFYKNNTINNMKYEINWISHLIGVIAAGVFIKCIPRKEDKINVDEKKIC